MSYPTLNTEKAGKIAFVRGKPSVIKCEVVGTFCDGNYTRVKLLERDGAHLVGDVVDYGSEWIA